MNKKVKKYLKVSVTILIVALFVWFLIVYPLVKFRGYEKQMKQAAERYFVTKPGELPTGERIKTITLQDLFFGAYIKSDMYVPYTKEPCSLKDSWVKVQKKNNEYKYYTYLKCGVLSSNIDHKGPTITLKGDQTINVTKGDNFKDPGVESVIDNKDGNIDVSKVTITGNVDTTKTGSYKIKYTALDSLNNKTEVERTVEVVERLKSTVKDILGDKTSFVGNPENNYVYFSNMKFRILDMDGDNIRIVSAIDIANVNYDGIENWLDKVFYKHLNSKSKKLIVENKYCNMKPSDDTLADTNCTSYTENKKVYIPSIVDVNKTNLEYDNFMKTYTMSWVASEKNKDEAYIIRDFFVEGDMRFLNLNKKYTFGVRPIITIDGNSLIKGGSGSVDDPYYLEDMEKGKTNSLVNERNCGEYVEINGMLFRIIDSESDGTTKVIAASVLSSDGLRVKTNYLAGQGIYNPTEKGNVGYYINNIASDYIDSSYFVNKTITVPIYKEEPVYGKTNSTKKYKVKFSAPSTFDMFSAGGDISGSYWLIDSSKNNKLANVISEIGSHMYDETGLGSFGIRLVGYLKKDVTIVSGKGTFNNPYKISK